MSDYENLNEDYKSSSAFQPDEDLYGKQIKAVPKPEKNIGIDTQETLLWDIASAQSGQVDISEIEKFTSITNDRNTMYSFIDQMASDSILSTALEYYAEDSTERNQQGRIVWAEANDGDVAKYITFLLDSLNVDKYVYKWVYSLCKYGDLYVRLFRESDVKDDLFDDVSEDKKTLNEDIKVRAYSKSDKYVHYVEMVPNPAEMFELTKFGKSYAYIQAPSTLAANYDYTTEEAWLANSQNRYVYKFKKDDVTIFPPTEFVHAILDENIDRFPETVDIFRSQADYDEEKTDLSYSVRRGSSMLANMFKIWRELMLLENSVLLNRITKSSIVRLIQVQIGDMPKEMVGKHLNGVKQLIEQKSAIRTGQKLSEYTNPGPIENNVYIPIRGENGTISTSQIGGDVDVKSLADLDYFRDKLFGQLGIPKQFLGFTEDGAGFNGGESLTLISSKYAKRVKKVQSAICQMITDIINLMLLDKNQTKYINKFSIHMVEPMTEEEKNRQENLSGEIQVVRDVMDLLNDIDDPSVRLRALKALLANVVTNTEVIDIIQGQIDALEESEKEGDGTAEEKEDLNINVDNDIDMDIPPRESGSEINDIASGETEPTTEEEPEVSDISGQEEVGELPNMNDLGLDFADSTQF